MGEQSPAEHHVLADAEVLESGDDARRLDPGWIDRAAGLADRTRAEHPERPPSQPVGVPAQEPPGVTAPVLDVDRAAKHHGVVGVKRRDLVGRHAFDAQARFAKLVGDLLGNLGGRTAL